LRPNRPNHLVDDSDELLLNACRGVRLQQPNFFVVFDLAAIAQRGLLRLGVAVRRLVDNSIGILWRTGLSVLLDSLASTVFAKRDYPRPS
jgi:hypothetical protein